MDRITLMAMAPSGETYLVLLEEFDQPPRRFHSEPLTADHRAARDRWGAQQHLAA